MSVEPPMCFFLEIPSLGQVDAAIAREYIKQLLSDLPPREVFCAMQANPHVVWSVPKKHLSKAASRLVLTAPMVWAVFGFSDAYTASYSDFAFFFRRGNPIKLWALIPTPAQDAGLL